MRVLGELDDYATSTNYLITPVVGAIQHPYVYRPHAGEVAEVLEVPLSLLREPARHTIEMMEWQGQKRPVHYFDAGSCIVWGVTARILLQLLDLVATMQP